MPSFRKRNPQCDFCGSDLYSGEARKFRIGSSFFTVCKDSTKTDAKFDADGDPNWCASGQIAVVRQLEKNPKSAFYKGDKPNG
jgi:ribosome-binding protein aMBF1 (putative translation factor)